MHAHRKIAVAGATGRVGRTMRRHDRSPFVCALKGKTPSGTQT